MLVNYLPETQVKPPGISFFCTVAEKICTNIPLDLTVAFHHNLYFVCLFYMSYISYNTDISRDDS